MGSVAPTTIPNIINVQVKTVVGQQIEIVVESMFFLVIRQSKRSFDCARRTFPESWGAAREGESLRRAPGTWSQNHCQHADDQRRDEAGTDEVHLYCKRYKRVHTVWRDLKRQ